MSVARASSRHPEASLRRREPSRDPRRERVHTREQRLHPRCRGKCFERRLMLRRGRRAACPSPRAEALRRPGQRVDRRPPRRGAASALPRRTRPSRSPCRQPPQARARVSADRPSHDARPGLPPDGHARARSRPRPSSTGSLDARDTRPRGRVGRSSGRASAPSERCRSASASRPDHVSTIPRFSSATARSSLPIAI